jgi:hypothetical protein
MTAETSIDSPLTYSRSEMLGYVIGTTQLDMPKAYRTFKTLALCRILVETKTLVTFLKIDQKNPRAADDSKHQSPPNTRSINRDE